MFCFAFALAFRNEFITVQSESSQTVILSKIITNLLIKYFGNDQYFISFIIPPMKKRTDYVEEDLLAKFFSGTTLPTFQYNIRKRLHKYILKEKQEFNVILIGDYKWLR